MIAMASFGEPLAQASAGGRGQQQRERVGQLAAQLTGPAPPAAADQLVRA